MIEDKETANTFLDAFNKLCNEYKLSFHVWPDGEIEIVDWFPGKELWVFDSREEFVYPTELKK